MTKKDILNLLDEIEDDDEVYMLESGKVMPVCLIDSGMAEVNFDDGCTQRVMVLSHCNCHEGEGGGVQVPELCYN